MARTDERFKDALSQQTISMVVFGQPKTGKSTLAATCPKPILYLDAEAGSRFLPLRKKVWDPRNPPPELDGSWDAAVVPVTSWPTIGLVLQWLKSGQHPFASVVVDSLTEVQRRAKKDINALGLMRTQDWGVILNRIEDLVTEIRDLNEHPTNPTSAVVFICEMQFKDELYRPFLQGRIAMSLPYKTDLCCNLFVADVEDDTDVSGVRKERQLLTGPDARFESGERVQGRLPHIVSNPNVTEMLDRVYDPRWTGGVVSS